MDTDKIITVTIWATIALIAYELFFKSGLSSYSTGTAIPAPIPVANPQGNAISVGNAQSQAQIDNAITANSLENDYQPSPDFFSSGGEMGVLGEYGY